MQDTNYIQEDEIDLRELFKTLMDSKKLIMSMTLLITFFAVVYVYFKNPTPIYSGSILIEIGKGISPNTGTIPLDNPYGLKSIVEKKFSVSSAIPKSTKNILVISSNNTDKEKITSILEEVSLYVIKKHKEESKLFDKSIMSKQIGDISISDTPVNTPKKKLIVVVAFVTGFILSIFLVFFLAFIRNDEK